MKGLVILKIFRRKKGLKESGVVVRGRVVVNE